MNGVDAAFYRRNGNIAPVVCYGQGWVSELGSSCILDPSASFGNSGSYNQAGSTGFAWIGKDIDQKTGRIFPGSVAGAAYMQSVFGLTDRQFSLGASYGTPGNTIHSGGSGAGYNSSNVLLAASTSTNGGAGGAAGASNGVAGSNGSAPGGGGGAGNNANGGAGAAGRVRVRIY